MSMKLGIITSCDAEGIRWAAAKGLKYAEFCYNVGHDISLLEEMLPEIKKAMEETGVKLGSIGRWGTRKIAEDGSLIESEYKDTCRMIDIAAELGCPVFNTGVNYVDSLPFLTNIECAKAFLEKVVAYGKTKGVKVATYNCDWDNFVRTPDVWKLIHGALPELGLKYDPSHCINSGSGKYLEEIRDWGDRIYHFHIKGTINISGEHEDDPPAGLDGTNWRAIMGLLYAKEYDGMLSIEPHSRTWRGAMGEWGVDFTIKYISEMIYPGE